jgi:hypothetical protein
MGDCSKRKWCDRQRFHWCKLTGYECEEPGGEDTCEVYREFTEPTAEEIRAIMGDMRFHELRDEGRL